MEILFWEKVRIQIFLGILRINAGQMVLSRGENV